MTVSGSDGALTGGWRSPAFRPLSDIEFFGPTLVRPECVLATARGELFVADGRGGYAVIGPGNETRLVLPRQMPEGFLPNGIALLQDRSVLIANLGPSGGVWRLTQDGVLTPFLCEFEDKSLPPVNFVAIDEAGRIWITVSTRQVPSRGAATIGYADGYILVVDRQGARCVADGLGFTNEAKVDPSGEWLYVNETIARRLSRFRLQSTGLGPRETVAEFDEMASFPDGLSFDCEGAVWITTVIGNGILRVLPGGEVETHFLDLDTHHVQEAEVGFRAGQPVFWSAGNFSKLNLPASLAFSGPDLRTAVVGFVKGDRLARFQANVSGARPPHWHF